MWSWLAGSSRPAGGETPKPDLAAIAAVLTQRLGVEVHCSQIDHDVRAEIELVAHASASLSDDKITNRLERQLERAASLIRL